MKVMEFLKKTIFIFALFFLVVNVFAQDDIVIDDPAELEGASTETEKINLAGVSEVPAAKRPKAPDSEKVDAAAKKDKDEDEDKKRRDTIQFGIEGELTDLIKNLIVNEDPRYSEELYDLFQTTRSPAVREKILEYFAKFEDPCIEDYAVNLLNDPYDEKNSTVEQAFRYIAAVKTSAAVPAVVTLLESENDSYFLPALTTLGEIGGEQEARYLVQFLERTDLTTPQRQQLMRVLGKINAVETWESLVEIAQDEGENAFVRAYAAEAIGAMKKPESVPVLVKLFESNDPNLRCYVIKGIANYETSEEAQALVIQGIKDAQYKVRLEAIEAAKNMKITSSVPYIVYRAKNDNEKQVKSKACEMLAIFGSPEADEYLLGELRDKKSSDSTKYMIAEIILKNSDFGHAEIADLAMDLIKDNRRKPFCTSIGKLIAKYPHANFAKVCEEFLASSDTNLCSLGLDMYVSGKYESAEAAVQKIAEDKKNRNQPRAKKILKIED